MVTPATKLRLEQLLRRRGISPELRHNILCNLERAKAPAIARTIAAVLAMPVTNQEARR